ncbi:hypothetical protein [Agrobacterium sp. Azo12]|uniref:hypothetical protein n=1 Tax=Agrobacterium sp. Azo12 TaxID=3031129 RepID=UPI003F8D4D9A
MTSALRGSHFFTALQLEEIKAVVAVNDHCSHYASVIEFAKMIDDHRSACHAFICLSVARWWIAGKNGLVQFS